MLIRSLLFSALLSAIACASDYRGLMGTAMDRECLDKIRPSAIATSWYKAGVDVMGRHISGLLLVKEMPDNAKRVVFTNEAGLTFFDFGFLEDRSFKVYAVIPQLKKKAVINLLRDDFSLLLGIPFENAVWQSWQYGNESQIGVVNGKVRSFLVTDANCDRLLRLESGSDNTRKLSIQMFGIDTQQPDSIAIQHHTFAMRINLKKIQK